MSMGTNFIIRMILLAGLLVVLTTGCATNLPPLETVPEVDLERYMGDWYVIAFIPAFIEKRATNAIENYVLREDGDVDITYTFFKDSPDGERKEYNARGFIQENTNNAEWKVQFFWPIRFPFHVIELDEEYSYTVVGLPSRKYVWIMAREPQIDQQVYMNILQRLEGQGYEIEQIQTVQQEW